jgi:hypothetical protein
MRQRIWRIEEGEGRYIKLYVNMRYLAIVLYLFCPVQFQGSRVLLLLLKVRGSTLVLRTLYIAYPVRDTPHHLCPW